jgi:hypothetical protein
MTMQWSISITITFIHDNQYNTKPRHASLLPVVTSLGQARGAAGTRACCLLRHQAAVKDCDLDDLLRVGAGRKADWRRETLMEHSIAGQWPAATCCVQGR